MPTIPCSRARRTPTCRTWRPCGSCWPMAARSFPSSRRTMRTRLPPCTRRRVMRRSSSSACTAWARRSMPRWWARASCSAGVAGRAASMRRLARTRTSWPTWCGGCSRTAPTPPSSTGSPTRRRRWTRWCATPTRRWSWSGSARCGGCRGRRTSTFQHGATVQGWRSRSRRCVRRSSARSRPSWRGRSRPARSCPAWSGAAARPSRC